jgi:adenylate cyclase
MSQSGRRTGVVTGRSPIEKRGVADFGRTRLDIVEGEVPRSGTRVRVTAQLIDAETDAHLWAERFSGDAGDLFALQDEITHRIAIALDLELVDAAAARLIERPDTRDYILRGRAARLKPASRENRSETVQLFERALALDQGSVAAQS